MGKKYECYSGVYEEMVELLGEEVTVKIYNNFRGQQVTFPMRLHSKAYVEEYLINNYNGKNIKQLSRWSYVNIWDTKSQTFLCYISSH